MPLKALIFDFDLTLADATKGIYQCMNHALSQFGYSPISDETIKKTIGYSIPVSFSMLTENHDAETAKNFTSVFVAHADKVMNPNTFVYHEALELLPKVKKHGIKTAIVSTKFRYRINGVLEREKLTQYFDYVIGGEDVVMHKPNPEGLLIAIEKLEIDKELALYIGDSVVDAEAAQNAGIKFCAVLTGTTSLEEFQQRNADHIIQNLNGLFEVLSLLNS